MLFIFKIGFSQKEKLDDYKVANINNVISLFKQINTEEISHLIAYPLQREYPISNINNETELKQRFSEVFDKALIDKIANSKVKQWSEVGWRGIMLDQGIIWIESETGKIIAVNHQSDYEKNLRQDLIAKDKQNLYVSLKTFESPTYKIKTKNYLIRIDELTNNKYRYASWKKDDNESSKPDIILKNGELEFQGSGGNHVIIFKNGKYIYKIYRNIIGEENTSDITLEIKRGDKTILTEDGILIFK